MIIAISGKIGSGKDTVAQIIQYLTDHRVNTTNINVVDNEDDFPSSTFMEFEIWKSKEYYKYSNWEIKKFAGTLKQICSLLTGIPVADFEKQEVKDSFLGEEWNYSYRYNFENKMTRVPVAHGYKDNQLPIPFNKEINRMKTRELLQIVGTECLRNNLHENVWVNALFANYRSDKSKWIISDLRFPNELKAVKDKGGVTIRINREWITMEDGTKALKRLPNEIIPQHPSETSLDAAEFDYTIENEGSMEELVQKVKDILIDLKIISVSA